VKAAAQLHSALLNADLKLPIVLMGANVADGDQYDVDDGDGGIETYSVGDYDIVGHGFTAYVARQDQAEGLNEENDVACFANFELNGCFSIDFEGDRDAFVWWATASAQDLTMAAIIPSKPPEVPTPKTERRLRPPARRTA
jgi:hypothetical protein